MDLSPDNLPWYLNLLLKESRLAVNVSWHIHSSVPNEKVAKIKAFVNKLNIAVNTSKINLRLIFKYGKIFQHSLLYGIGGFSTLDVINLILHVVGADPYGYFIL